MTCTLGTAMLGNSHLMNVIKSNQTGSLKVFTKTMWCVRNNKQTVCKQTGGTFKPVDKHLTQKPPQIYKCCYNCLFQICSIPKWWNYIYSIACEKKRCLLQFIHQQLILYRESQRSWPTLKKLKVLYVECINALSNF